MGHMLSACPMKLDDVRRIYLQRSVTQKRRVVGTRVSYCAHYRENTPES